MISNKIAALLNEQINKELFSAYLYWDMSHYFETRGLDGFAQWYMVQAEEEYDHAQRIYRYLVDNDICVTLTAIETPSRKYECVMDVLQSAYEHEEYITESIHNLYCAAHQEKDLRTMEFLNWFINEQAEEETHARSMIDKMKLFGNDGKGLYQLNREFGKRNSE
ncbi:MAG: ferritin [Bacteroidales bacterium]|nr:ferritin [Bacteroidales bacterium]